MGKFGKHKLPNLLLDVGTVEFPLMESNDDLAGFIEKLHDLQKKGIIPKGYQPTKPKILKIHYERPKELGPSNEPEPDVRMMITDLDLWAKVITVYGEKKILHFIFDKDSMVKDDDHPAYKWGDFDAFDMGWKYTIPGYIHANPNLDWSIEDLYPTDFKAEEYDEDDYDYYSHRKNRTHEMKNTTGKVYESFEEFEEQEAEVNEDDVMQVPTEQPQPCDGCSDHPDQLSENAKMAIQKICNEVLIREAHVFETSEDPNQTYESFLRECTHYMAECLIRAAQNLKV